MGVPVAQRTYNLLEEKWIPVLYGDGETDRVGIYRALKDACIIRQVAASNPMDRVAILRFLSAILLWCIEDAKHELVKLDEKSASIREGWLAKLKEHETAFNLLGDGLRFYQDVAVRNKETRPITDLLVEFPGADSVNHMRHVVHDGSYGFCPACCALGILRLSVWAPANRYYPASVNPGTATYAFVEGKNLLLTLHANLPDASAQSDRAPWLCSEQPRLPDAVARLAWRPRKLWLNVGKEHGDCANCRGYGVLITSLCNEGGWPTPTTDGQNFSRAVAAEFKKLGYNAKGKDQANKNAQRIVKKATLIRDFRMDKLREACNRCDPAPAAPRPMPETDESEIAWLFHKLILKNDEVVQKTIKALLAEPNEEEKNALGDGDMRSKKFWDEDPHLLKDGEPISLPGLGADVSMHSSRFWRDALHLRRQPIGKVEAIGPVVNKFVFQDINSVALPDASPSATSLAKLSADCTGELINLLRQVTPNHDRQHPEIQAAVVLLTPNAEAHIRNRLNRLNASTDESAINGETFLHEVYNPLVKQVMPSVIQGSPLCRHTAMNKAQALLNKTIRKLVERANQPADASTPGSKLSKSKRRGMKHGGIK